MDVVCRGYHQKAVLHQDGSKEKPVSPKENPKEATFTFVCHQLLAQHNKNFVRHDRAMEQILFPIPEMLPMNLTKST